MRKMLPSANGTSFDIAARSDIYFEYRYYMDPIWQANQIKSLAYFWNHRFSPGRYYNAAINISNFSSASKPCIPGCLPGAKPERKL